MNHPMAVRADQREVFEPRALTGAQSVDRLDVMAFDEAIAVIAVDRGEVESARLARQLARLAQHAGRLGCNELGAALATDMLRRQHPALWRLPDNLAVNLRVDVRHLGDRLVDGA